MNKKRLLKLSAIIIGVIMSFCFNKVQASEITSEFTGETITRSNIQTLSSEAGTISTDKILGISKNRESGNYYQWNINTVGEGKTAWKIATYSSTNSNAPDYSDLYYCLNATRGFGITNGLMAEGAKDEYLTGFDMKDSTNKTNIINYAGGNLGTNYNKILWILDNSYIPTGSTSYKTSEEYKALMKNAKINIENDISDLTEEQIEVVQQMAIWYFTNTDDGSYHLESGNLPSIYINGKQLSNNYYGTTEYGEQISGTVIWNKMNKLYKYYINNAQDTYTPVNATLNLSKANAKVTELGNYYVAGPFTLSKSDISITDLVVELNNTKLSSSEYLLVSSEDSNSNITNLNDLNTFYLKINKNKVTGDLNININVKGKYFEKKLTFMTDASDANNTQAVVLVKNEERDPSISINTTTELMNISVEKIWNDSNNQDGVRPEEVKVQLYKNGEVYGNSITLNNTNNWTYTWNKLLNDTYTVKEINSSNTAVENNTKYNEDYTTTYSVQNNKTTITNTHIPEKISKTVTKLWEDKDNQDGIRPENITVSLFKTVNNITQKAGEVELSGSNNWTYTWNELDKYENGKEIVYKVEEIVPDGYTPSYSEDTFTITNKYTPGVISKTVIKEWEDQDNVDGIRPDEITVQLYANDVAYGDEIVLSKENAFTYTWTNLPEKENGELVNYTISEVKIGEEEVENNEAADYTVAYEVAENITIITNAHTPDTTTKTVTKVWDDNDYKGRPEAIKIQLYADGKAEGDPITLSSGNDKIWQSEELSYTWTNLPLKKNGETIEYTVKELNSEEEPIEDGKMYDDKYTTTYSEDTFTITNTYREFDLALRKFITQINDEKYSREPRVDTSTIATTGTATYKHEKVPVAVQKGDVVTYTIRVYNEGEIDGYVNEITDHLPENLLPIIDGVEGIDSEKYKEEIEFNNNWLWEFTGNGETVKTKITEADKATNLPGISEDKQEDARLLKLYEEGSNTLDYVDVQIKCLVTNNVVSGEYLTNIAEITDSEDINGLKGDGLDSELKNVDYSNLSDYRNEEAINSTKDSYVKGQEDDDDFEKLVVKEFDLSLRKFITKVNETVHSREPAVDTSKLGTESDGKTITTATYNHTKEPVLVETNDIVTYTIRIYNEGSLAGYATEITDDIPEGLEFLPDSSINVSYRWKMIDEEGNETEDVSKAVIIVTDYLSDSNESNIIEAVSEADGVKTLSYKDVEVQFKVIAKPEKLKDNIIINEAQISADSDRDIDSIPNRDEKYDYTSGNNEDDIDYEPIKLQYFDLALRKFITKVNDTDYNNRYPEVIYNEDGSIKYEHTKDPVLVKTEDTVTYTIRIYNEGEKSGYATEITDDMPEGLEFLPQHETNKLYSWKMIDQEGNVTEDVAEAKKITTDALKDEIIDALIVEDNQKVLSYKDVKVAFKVTKENTSKDLIINTAEISQDSDNDIDSTPGNNVELEDDIDKEYLRVEYFDLSLKKWVTATKVTYNGKTTTTKTGFTEDTNKVAKVDIVAKRLKKTTVKFVYSIKVTNEGETAGYAYEVKDYIPKGLKFVAADNKDWKEEKDGIVVTDKLKDTLLEPGESATVEIVLTWKNSSTNMGLKTNYAEISEDSGDDIDSTPDNYNLKEDDIDDAQVILSIKTAGSKTYIGLVLTSVAILAAGVILIKKYVIK